MSQLALAANRLFGQAGSSVVTNFKLFPGSNRDVTPEQLAEEVNKALSQVESGDSIDVTFDE